MLIFKQAGRSGVFKHKNTRFDKKSSFCIERLTKVAILNAYIINTLMTPSCILNACPSYLNNYK